MPNAVHLKVITKKTADYLAAVCVKKMNEGIKAGISDISNLG